jgi:hypothetical protein
MSLASRSPLCLRFKIAIPCGLPPQAALPRDGKRLPYSEARCQIIFVPEMVASRFFFARMAMWSSAGSANGPSPADLRSAASPAPRARRYGRCRGQGSGKGDEASGMEDGVPCARTDPLPPTAGRRPLSPAGTSGPSRPAPAPAASPRPRRCAGEAIWPLLRPGPVQGDDASSMGAGVLQFGPSPADLRSAASPAPRARRYGRCRGRVQGDGASSIEAAFRTHVPCPEIRAMSLNSGQEGELAGGRGAQTSADSFCGLPFAAFSCSYSPRPLHGCTAMSYPGSFLRCRSSQPVRHTTGERSGRNLFLEGR